MLTDLPASGPLGELAGRSPVRRGLVQPDVENRGGDELPDVARVGRATDGRGDLPIDQVPLLDERSQPPELVAPCHRCGALGAIIDASVATGASRLVWTWVANPGLDPDPLHYARSRAPPRLQPE